MGKPKQLKPGQIEIEVREMSKKDLAQMEAHKASIILCFDKQPMEFEILNEEDKKKMLKKHKTLDAYAKSKGWKDVRILRVSKHLMDTFEFAHAGMKNIVGDEYDY